MIMRFRLFLLLLLTFLVVSSCSNPFHPKLRDGDPSSVNDSPLTVLNALEQAYTQKNIELFKKCLAPYDFRFELLSAEVNIIGIDWNNDNIKDSWWGYDQEVEYHENLFLEGSSDGSYPPPDQINLSLLIPPQAQWETDPQTGHEEWVVIPCLFDLQLLFTSSNSSIASNGVARFYLKPVNNKWYIAVWRDESNI